MLKQEAESRGQREERKGVKKIIIIIILKVQRRTKYLWAEGDSTVTIQQIPGVISVH